MLAIWEWTKAQILSSFDNIDNLITIQKKYNWWEPQMMPWWWYSVSATPYEVSKEVVTMEIADTLKEKVFWISDVVYTIPVNVWDINYNSKPFYWEVLWVSNWYFFTKWYKIKDWAYFSNSNYENDDKAVILWYEVIRNYLYEEWFNPIWKTIFLWGSPFIIQWILAKNNWQTDYAIYIPITTAVNRLWAKDLQKIEVFTDKRLEVSDVKRDLQYYLFKQSGVSHPADAKFTVRTNEDALKQVNEIIWQMKLLLWAIGSIALIVWWIWIMNIMLVSVTERTREIWIRKSIWATKTNIMFQFLMESVILSMIWCIIAVGLCYLLVYIINRFWEASWFSALITSSVLLMASWVSIAMWIIFGLMPAWKAARLKPIDALRFE